MSTDLSLPRILCLHGGGVNANVFQLQCRAIIHALKDRFRLVFADGPFSCPPHPDIVPVYGDCGPFFRWLRWKPDEHAAVDAVVASRRIVDQCRRAMAADPGRGPWVGLLGFSQGAKIAASLLWSQEHMSHDARPLPDVWFRFGVLMAGGGPVVKIDTAQNSSFSSSSSSAASSSSPSLSFQPPSSPFPLSPSSFTAPSSSSSSSSSPSYPPCSTLSSPPSSSSTSLSSFSSPLPPYIVDAAHLSLVPPCPPGCSDPWPTSNEHGEHLISIPTLHVHGLLDSGLDSHQLLWAKYCKARTTRLVQWQGAHRLPIKTQDVAMVVDNLIDMALETGVIGL